MIFVSLSKSISLFLFLFFYQINSNSADITNVAMKIQPDFTTQRIYDRNRWVYNRVLSDSLNHNSSSVPMPPIDSHLPESLLQHHSMREIQIINLDIVYKQEVQVHFLLFHANSYSDVIIILCIIFIDIDYLLY